MGALKKLCNWLNDVFVLFGGVALLGMMVVACANMILRLLGRPISATYEIVGFLGALTVALPLGYAQLKKSHVAVDIVSSRFPTVLRRIVVALSLILGMIFFFVAAWKVGAHAYTLQQVGEVSETLRMPFYPFVYGVAAACGLMTFTLLTDFLLLLFPGEEGGA